MTDGRTGLIEMDPRARALPRRRTALWLALLGCSGVHAAAAQTDDLAEVVLGSEAGPAAGPRGLCFDGTTVTETPLHPLAGSPGSFEVRSVVYDGVLYTFWIDNQSNGTGRIAVSTQRPGQSRVDVASVPLATPGGGPRGVGVVKGPGRGLTLVVALQLAGQTEEWYLDLSSAQPVLQHVRVGPALGVAPFDVAPVSLGDLSQGFLVSAHDRLVHVDGQTLAPTWHHVLPSSSSEPARILPMGHALRALISQNASAVVLVSADAAGVQTEIELGLKGRVGLGAAYGTLPGHTRGVLAVPCRDGWVSAFVSPHGGLQPVRADVALPGAPDVVACAIGGGRLYAVTLAGELHWLDGDLSSGVWRSIPLPFTAAQVETLHSPLGASEPTPFAW